MTVLRAALAALAFLTRVPAPGQPFRAAELAWSTAWFPAVGAGLGWIYAQVFAHTAPALGAVVAAILVVAAALLLTGAFHEDGLADTADALGGAYERGKLFEILKDSRIGTFGAAALFVALALRVALLVRLGPAAPAALITVECLSRLAPVGLMIALPYVTADGVAKSRQVARAGAGQTLLAAALTAAVLLPRHAIEDVAILAGVAVAATTLCGWRFHVRAGGLTGDFLGATQQVCCVALLVALCF
jgi:adenosylcobinamide-GDP ribazoletransferase